MLLIKFLCIFKSRYLHCHSFHAKRIFLDLALQHPYKVNLTQWRCAAIFNYLLKPIGKQNMMFTHKSLHLCLLFFFYYENANLYCNIQTCLARIYLLYFFLIFFWGFLKAACSSRHCILSHLNGSRCTKVDKYSVKQ